LITSDFSASTRVMSTWSTMIADEERARKFGVSK
jgi:hypothetical protein